MIGKRNVSVCSGHELANALYICATYNEVMKHFDKDLIAAFYEVLKSKMNLMVP